METPGTILIFSTFSTPKSKIHGNFRFKNVEQKYVDKRAVNLNKAYFTTQI